MNIKKILFLLFIGVGVLPSALQAGELAIEIRNQDGVTDWSSVVCKQKENTCAFHAVKNAQLLFDYLSPRSEADRKASDEEPKNSLGAEEDSASFPLSDWQSFIRKQVNLEGSELKRVAVERAQLDPKHFTVIDGFEDFMRSFDKGPMLADEGAHIPLYSALLRLKSQTPSIPHIFFLGSMQQERHNGIGHWVTCVATVNRNSGLELHYADSMDPGNIQTLDPAEREKIKSEWGINSLDLDQVLNENAQITQETISKRKIKFTGLLKQLIHEKNPIQLLLTSPLGNSLDSVEHLNRQRKQQNALPHLRTAVQYVQDWQLLENPAFMATDYPQRIKKAMVDTLPIEITDRNFKTIIEELYSTELEELERKYNLVQPAPIVNSSQPQISQAINLDQNSLEARLQQIQKQKNKKSWFQRFTSYIAPTPQRVLIAGFCTAACWMLKKMLDNISGGSSTTA